MMSNYLEHLNHQQLKIKKNTPVNLGVFFGANIIKQFGQFNDEIAL